MIELYPELDQLSSTFMANGEVATRI